MFDSHCHLDRIADDPEAALRRAKSAGVTDLVIAGVNPSGWEEQLAWVQPGVTIAVGLPPWAVSDEADQTLADLSALEEFIQNNAASIRGIGETGLDFGAHCSAATHDNQRTALRTHLQLAVEWNLPLVLHVVNAHGAVIDILRQSNLPAAGGMVHSFSGSAEIAREYIRLGLCVSFSGAITNPERKRLRQALASVPDHALLVETDAPDQTPWNRRPSPNEPAFLIDVIAAAAEIRNQSPEDVARLTATNARKLFHR